MKRTTWILSLGTLALSIAVFAGCGGEEADSGPVSINTDPEAIAQFVLNTEPAGAVNVDDAVAAENDGKDVIVVGKIGNIGLGATPWVEGLASFKIVDLSRQSCADIDDDHCATPWDYCCDSANSAASIASVKFTDEGGVPLEVDAKTSFQLAELQTVVVRGKAKRDDGGNLIIEADGVFVRK